MRIHSSKLAFGIALGIGLAGGLMPGLVPSAYAQTSSSACSGYSSAVVGCSAGYAATVTTPEAAARFLNMATYGATEEEVQRLLGMGLDAWLKEQLSMPATLHRPLVEQAGSQDSQLPRLDVWWKLSLTAPDQLRQRVALALSEVLVASDQMPVYNKQPAAMAQYYDLLLQGAFGNFRKLIEDVTLSPVMGQWLNMRGNNGTSGLRADENYARELMQLFTIGLVVLNENGSVVLDGSGAPISTYTQAQVTDTARALTGWSLAGATNFNARKGDYYSPMTPFAGKHDTGSKTIVGGKLVPAGQSTADDLKTVLDTLFQHPNLPPFLCRQLIQKLVTANPSPQYVQRVVNVFKNDGSGTRGNLSAVVAAILTDVEALAGPAQNSDFGRRREPLTVYTHLWRALHAQPVNGIYRFSNSNSLIGQMPLSSETVFNFFEPQFAPLGNIRDAGLAAPEFQLATNSLLVSMLNNLRVRVMNAYVGTTATISDGALVDLSALATSASDPATLVDRVTRVLIGYPLPANIRTAIVNDVASISASAGSKPGYARTQEAVYAVLASPNYMVFR